jgi:hypothetical protein
MASWYVEMLIRNREYIRGGIYSGVRSDLSEPSYALNLDDDLYSDLLIVEKTIKYLYKEHRLSKKEVQILRLFLDGKNIVDVEKETGITRLTVSKIFTELCDKVGYLLGGQFNDEGFIDYMVDKYDLTSEQANRLASFLESNKRHSFNLANIWRTF